jgi:hypothetical protein
MKLVLLFGSWLRQTLDYIRDAQRWRGKLLNSEWFGLNIQQMIAYVEVTAFVKVSELGKQGKLL